MDSPNALSPAELMIALHQLDIEDGALIKQVIAATKLLFSYKNIYNKNVLAIVLQQLVELHPIPPLFMRTVIQSVVNSPELARFTIGILSRLVKVIKPEEKTFNNFVETSMAKSSSLGRIYSMCQDALSNSSFL